MLTCNFNCCEVTHYFSFTCWKDNVTHFFHGSLQILNKLQPERSLVLSDIYIKYSTKEFNYNERTLSDFANRPNDGLFKLKHLACFTSYCELSTTTWKKKCSSIIRSEAYNKKSMTPRIISLFLATHYTIAMAQALHCFNTNTVSVHT